MDMPRAPSTPRTNLTWLLFLASSVVLSFTLSVLKLRIGGEIEITVRITASILGLAGVPALLALACKDWLTRPRSSLPAWRRGVGLIAIVLLFTAWLIPILMALLTWSRAFGPNPFGDFELEGTVFACSLLGLILGIALRGKARPQTLSAALLLWTSFAASIYF